MERIEVKTKAAAEKAIKAGQPIHIVGGKFALALVGLVGVDIHVSADIRLSLTDTRGIIVTRGTSAPTIETRGTSAPTIETWDSSAPTIETWDSSAPRIVTWNTSAPTIETWDSSAPRIVTWNTSAPRIVTWGTSAPTINKVPLAVPVVILSGFRWRITIHDTRMAIGCEEHELSRWWSFDDRVIDKMDSNALDFWKANKAHLQAICAATGRVAE